MTISLNAYAAALEEVEIEKTAQRIVDDYGTSEGFMPEAYILAFDNWEHEKRAEYLVNTYGTMQGALPPSYAVAFDDLEKEAKIFGAKPPSSTSIMSAIPYDIRRGEYVAYLNAKAKERPTDLLTAGGAGALLGGITGAASVMGSRIKPLVGLLFGALGGGLFGLLVRALDKGEIETAKRILKRGNIDPSLADFIYRTQRAKDALNEYKKKERHSQTQSRLGRIERKLEKKAGAFQGIRDFGALLKANPRSDELEKAHKLYEKKTGKGRNSMTYGDHVEYVNRIRGTKKEAGLQALGQTIAGGVRRAGNALKASGTKATAEGTGGTMRTSLGDKVVNLSRTLRDSAGAQKALGGAALATPAVAYMAG